MNCTEWERLPEILERNGISVDKFNECANRLIEDYANGLILTDIEESDADSSATKPKRNDNR